MDIKKILKICKKSNHYAYVKENQKTWWMGDGNSLYCLNNVKKLTLEYITALAGLEADEVEKSFFKQISSDNLSISFNDNDEETHISCADITINFGDGEFTPIFSSRGIRYIPSIMFTPFKKEEFDIYERYTDEGDMYFVIKVGMFVRGIILDMLCHINFESKHLTEKIAQYTNVAYTNYEKSLKKATGVIDNDTRTEN